LLFLPNRKAKDFLKAVLTGICWFARPGKASSADIAMLGSTAAGSTCFLLHNGREDDMPESVYKVIELIGTSNKSWEDAATNAVQRAAKSLRDLRVAEVIKLDMQLDEKGKVETYRAKLNVSFKFEGS
jgi:dodecin